MNTNLGLLRVLAPDIFAFLLLTILAVAARLFARRFISENAADDGVDHAKVVKANRNVARGVRWVWYVFSFLFLWHVFTVTWSLRIPRSDVDATGVYQQMDSLTK